tara:strand:- start:1668 stop:2261 length:594 start_codon:yes stop_codon:yes gene_type:complete
MGRGGINKKRDLAERTCLVCQVSGPKENLIRFVVSPDKIVVPDIMDKLPGRGYYVTSHRKYIEQAMKDNVFSQRVGRMVKYPSNLIDEIERQLAKRLVDLISISRKAGKAVTGFEKVKGWLADGRAIVLLQASDGSERGKGKLRTPEGGRFFGCLTAKELGLAFGRGHAIHSAIASGGLSERVVSEAARLSGFREVN